jgi:hypothetical protein
VYEEQYSSLAKSRFSVDNSRFSVHKIQASILKKGETQDLDACYERKPSQASMLLASGRPLFARDADKHLTPAPSHYRPDKYMKYDKKTKLQPRRSSIPTQVRWKEIDDEDSLPGPGQYHEVVFHRKKKPAFQIDTADRKLLNGNVKTSNPGPLSYDVVSGLSMCSSTKQMNFRN